MNPPGIFVPQEVTDEVFAMAERHEAYEAISQYMADANVEKILAIRLFSQATQIDLGEAKKFIHFSPAWSFRRASDDKFHTDLYKAYRQLENAESLGSDWEEPAESTRQKVNAR